MLPPFVPPSARVPSESLPLITEFVIERGAHASAAVAAPAEAPAPAATPPRAWTSEDAAELPSIDEFLMRRPDVEQHAPPSSPEDGREEQRAEAARAPEQPSAEAASQVESGPRPADQPASGVPPQVLEREEGEPIPPAQSEVILPPISADASEVRESTPPGARFNDEAADVEAEAPGITMGEAWEASAASPAVAGEEAAERAAGDDHRDVEHGQRGEPGSAQSEADHDEWGEEAASAASSGAAADTAWVADERDAFDWQSVGTIATGPDDARRAEEAWSGTEWEPRRNPEHEQVATALVQLARRVRAGEVKVELPANATVEASLAAVLAALLAGEERQHDRQESR